MFHTWSNAMQNRKVRGLLLLIGLLATVAFGPMSVLGVYLLATDLQSDAPDRFHFIGWSIVGSGGVLGITGGWLRLLVAGTYFQTHPVLKWLTVAALGAGVLVAALIFSRALWNPADLMAWLMVPTLVVGVFLLGATVGEVRSNNT
jgi:hypothetical protein